MSNRIRFLSAHYVYPVSSPPLKNGIVCVDDDGCIVDVIDTGGKLEEHEKLEFYNGILVPGFVNAHCHLELSHLRGVMAPNTGLPDFISSIGKLRKTMDEKILSAAKAADSEMFKNGIVAVGDISNNACTLPVKRDSSIWYRTFVELFGLDDNRSEEIFTAAKQIEQEYRCAEMPVSIVPHASYSVSQALWEMLQQSYTSSSPQVISMHHHECSDELNVFWEGKGELANALRKNGLLTGAKPENQQGGRKVEPLPETINLLVHNTFSSKDDICKYTKHLKQIYFVLCPGSNLFIQNRLPDLQLFSSQELYQNVCLGTDSLASNTRLSILEEMKIIQHYAPDIPLEMLLQWATINGARALGFDHLLGSFEKNKKPGVNLITGIDFEKMSLSTETEVEAL